MKYGFCLIILFIIYLDICLVKGLLMSVIILIFIYSNIYNLVSFVELCY